MSTLFDELPAPWSVQQLTRWPFELLVVAANGNTVLSEHPAAYSSKQKTLQDNLDAVDFPAAERAEVMAKLSQQRQRLVLFAEAPAMAEALREAHEYIAAHSQAGAYGLRDHDHDKYERLPLIEKLGAILARIEGERP